MSATEAAAAIAAGVRRVWHDAELRLCPMADGGEGTLAAVLSAGGERRSARVSGAAGAPVDAAYGLIANDTAIIESAQVVGLTDPGATAYPVERRSTRGLGELIRILLDAGVRRFVAGLGGSSTNDGGAGLLSALGLALLDAKGHSVEPTPAGLEALSRIDASAFDARLAGTRITILSDVDNPLCGKRGATAIFGPQKGVHPESVPTIDARLEHFAKLSEAAVGRSAKDLPGAGAAGGLGFALLLAGGELRSGAEVVADLLGLDAALEGADWLITGEGRTDRQTLLGKASRGRSSAAISPSFRASLPVVSRSCSARRRSRRVSRTPRLFSPIAPSSWRGCSQRRALSPRPPPRSRCSLASSPPSPRQQPARRST